MIGAFKGKGKVIHLMKVCGKSRGQLNLFLTLALYGGMRSTSRPSHSTPGKGTRYPLNRWLDGPHSWPVQYGQEINFIPMPRSKPQFIQPKV